MNLAVLVQVVLFQVFDSASPFSAVDFSNKLPGGIRVGNVEEKLQKLKVAEPKNEEERERVMEVEKKMAELQNVVNEVLKSKEAEEEKLKQKSMKTEARLRAMEEGMGDVKRLEKSVKGLLSM